MFKLELIHRIGPAFLIVCFISIGIRVGIWSSNSSVKAQASPKSQISEISVSVKNPASAPILITAPTSISTDSSRPSYSVLLTNVGKKAVRAYTLATEIFVGEKGNKVNESSLSHMIANELLMNPSQSRQEINNGNNAYPEPVIRIVVSIDFVEFSDGTSWGEDVYRSAESLEGQRAGGRAAISFFQAKLSAGTFDVAEVDVSSNEIAKTIDLNRSIAWKRGFESGVGIVRNRLKKSYAAGGVNDIVSELKRPFDASEGREKP